MAKLFKNIWKKMTLQGSDDKTPSCGWNMLRPLVSAQILSIFNPCAFFQKQQQLQLQPAPSLLSPALLGITWWRFDGRLRTHVLGFFIWKEQVKNYIYIYNSSFEKSQQQQKWIWPTQNQYEIKQIQTIIGLILWYTLLSLLNDTCTRLH